MERHQMVFVYWEVSVLILQSTSAHSLTLLLGSLVLLLHPLVLLLRSLSLDDPNHLWN